MPYLLLLPATLFLCVFFLYPFVLVAVEAFTRDGVVTLDNFRTMVGHWKFPETLPQHHAARRRRRADPARAGARHGVDRHASSTTGRSAILYIFAIPLGLSDLAAGPDLARHLRAVGLPQHAGSSASASSTSRSCSSATRTSSSIFIAVVLAEVWRATAIMMVILVAGMGLIPKEYYEAAEVFGAGAWKRFIKVTLPMLRPSLQTAIILRVILAFEVFAVVAALGGTNLPVLMGETYQLAVRAAGPQRRGRLRHADPRHLDRLHAVLPLRAARAEGGQDMTAVAADDRRPPPGTDARKAGRWLFIAGDRRCSAPGCCCRSTC